MTAEPIPRRARPDSRVSVIVPCFNHGTFLEECLASVEGQTHPAAEVIVVDDGSTDEYTVEVLDRVEAGGRARVIRQANSGPSAARNRAVEASAGDLVLPLDADNRLAPRGLEAMKEALLAAPDDVRWAYPHQSFFGSRDEFVPMPAFNLWLLMTRNFCDTGSLIDRSVFDAGCRYREDIGLGHEDWDFFLGAVERGFVGVPCHERVFFVRKHGFTRSDLVDHQLGSFASEMRKLRPRLFSPENMLRVKQEWAPALSVVVDGPAGPGRALLDVQSFQDFELVGRRRHGGRFLPPDRSAGEGRDEPGACSTLELLGRAKGRWVLVWSGAHLAPLADPGFLEKAVTVGESSGSPTAVALLGRAAGNAVHNWRPVAEGTSDACIGVLVSGSLLGELLPSLEADGGGAPLEQLLDAMAERTEVAWRSFRSTAGTTARPPGWTGRRSPGAAGDAGLDRTRPPPGDPELVEAAGALERQFRHHEAPALHLGNERVTRPPRPPRDATGDGWEALLAGGWSTWAPAHTRPLLLSFDPAGFRWQLELGSDDPNWTQGRFAVRIPLGRVYTHRFPGTVSLWSVLSPQTGTFSYRLGDPPSKHWCIPLGFVSTAHLPGMVNLATETSSHLDRLRAQAGGRPLPPFTVNGEQAAACIEAVQPPPARPAPSAICWPRWPVYEAVSSGGRVTYSTHPDASAVLAGADLRRAVTVARLVSPGATGNVLVEAVVGATGGRMYLNSPPNPLPEGASVSDALGSLVGEDGTLPLVRLASVAPGPHSAVPEPGHRIRTHGWEAFDEAGTHQPEGILGGAYPPVPEQAPLYRWRHVEREEWRYTLGCGVAGGAGDWRFEGTVGLAFAPTVDWPNLVDLLELRHPVTGRVGYACDGSPEVVTHHVVGVVARLYRTHEGATVPLFRLRGPHGETVYGVNPDELVAAGFRGERPAAAFVGVAVPPPSPRQPTRGDGVRRVVVGLGHHAVDGMAAEAHVPGSLAMVDEGGSIRVGPAPSDGAEVLGWAASGLFPWSVPLYQLVERHTGAVVVSTDGDIARAPTHAVIRVVGYLGSPAHEVDATAMSASDRPPAPPRAATGLSALTPQLGRSARRVVSELPPPAQRALRTTWRAVHRVRP